MSNTQSQNIEILRHLRAGKSVTQMEAYGMFQCTRLAARINDIKKILDAGRTGEVIESTMVHFTKENGNQGHCSRYFLKKS